VGEVGGGRARGDDDDDDVIDVDNSDDDDNDGDSDSDEDNRSNSNSSSGDSNTNYNQQQQRQRQRQERQQETAQNTYPKFEKKPRAYTDKQSISKSGEDLRTSDDRYRPSRRQPFISMATTAEESVDYSRHEKLVMNGYY